MFDYMATDFNIIGDNQTDNTDAIAWLIDKCEKGGGGTIYFPPGIYRTGPIKMKSYLTLYLSAGAKLLFDDNFNRYHPVYTRWSGYQCYAFSPLLYGENLEYITIKGEGVIDGQGKNWWLTNQLLKTGASYQNQVTRRLNQLNQDFTEPNQTNIVEWPSQFLRPALLQLNHCKHVKLEGITLQNSPFWNTHLLYCDQVIVDGLTIYNPKDTPNGDGLDIDSCQHVRISNCHFDVGDDCIAVKSGINEDGRKIAVPSQHITISNCTMIHGHGGVVLGSENSGGIKNVTISNCIFVGTDRGIRLKTNRARGSYIKQVLVNNIIMENCLCPIAINAFYRYGVNSEDPLMTIDQPIPITERTPEIEDIKLTDILAKGVRAAAGFIYGLPEMPIKNIILSNITIDMALIDDVEGGEPDMIKEPMIVAGSGIYGKYVKDFTCRDLLINTKNGPALEVISGENITLMNFQTNNKHESVPVVSFQSVSNYTIEGQQYEQLGQMYIELNERKDG
ncbi:glycoside hydrolase family 28 protein [Amphibacillus jilinensis]|uniref:glycoside hydrolase family 28 protein n=1 Tax=Amphibacillus jilinensis TaxID=1216008 RepID=UPI0002F15BA1|nr:glycoside hydrolase family 28 protein [Amphibacillus jilinensis]